MPTPPVLAVVKEINESQTLSEGAVGYERVRVFLVEGILKATDYLALASGTRNPLAYAAGLAGIPKRGDIFDAAIYPALYCMSRKIYHPSRGMDSVKIACQYGEIGAACYQNGAIDDGLGDSMDEDYASYTPEPRRWLISARLNGTVVQTLTSFDNTGKIRRVGFNMSSGDAATLAVFNVETWDGASPPPEEVLQEYISAPVSKVYPVIELNMREVATPPTGSSPTVEEWKTSHPLLIQQNYSGRINSAAIWGIPAYKLRLRVTVAEIDPLRSIKIVDPEDPLDESGNPTLPRQHLWDVQYTFERSFDKSGYIPIITLKSHLFGGYEPPGIADPSDATHGYSETAPRLAGNGWVAPHVELEADFNDLGLPDIRRMGLTPSQISSIPDGALP